MGILQARILVAMPSSRGSSQPRDLTQVSCIVGRFFTICLNHFLYMQDGKTCKVFARSNQKTSPSQTQLSDFTFIFHFHALEKEMATHSSILAWRIPGMEEPGGLQSTGSQRVGQDWVTSVCSRTLLFIHSTCKSLHLLTLPSHFIPPPTPSPLAITCLISLFLILFQR